MVVSPPGIISASAAFAYGRILRPLRHRRNSGAPLRKSCALHRSRDTQCRQPHSSFVAAAAAAAVQLQKTREYGDLINRIWSSLREEVQRARRQEEEMTS